MPAYTITPAGGDPRTVTAPTRQAAVAHVARDHFTVERVKSPPPGAEAATPEMRHRAERAQALAAELRARLTRVPASVLSGSAGRAADWKAAAAQAQKALAKAPLNADKLRDALTALSAAEGA